MENDPSVVHLNSGNKLNSLTIFLNDILLASKFLCMLRKVGHYLFNGYIMSDCDLSRQGIMASYLITYMHDSRVNYLLQAVLKEPLRAGRTYRNKQTDPYLKESFGYH